MLSTKSNDSSGSGSVYVYPHQDATLTYALSFDPGENKLHIRVKQLTGFRVSDPDGVMAPYVKVRVYICYGVWDGLAQWLERRTGALI